MAADFLTALEGAREDELLEGGVFRDQVLEGLEGSGMDFKGCTFEKCLFQRCDFTRAAFYACRFTACDFSGCRLDRKSVV